MPRKLFTLVLGALLMTAPVAKAQTSDDDTQTNAEEKDPTIEALERQQKIAELKQKIAEAEKATVAAKLPTTEGSGVGGDVTFGEGSGYFAELLAYQSMLVAADRIGDRIGSPDGDKEVLLVVDEDLALQSQLWEIAKTRLEDANKRLQDLVTATENVDFTQREAVAAALTTASALLGAAADIASFFRSDLAVTAREVSVTSTALLAATAKELASRGWKPLVPSSNLQKSTLLTKTETLLKTRRELVRQRRTLEAQVQPDLLKLAQRRLELETAEEVLKKAMAKKPADSKAVDAAQAEVLRIKGEIIPLANKKARWDSLAREIDATLDATDALVKALVEGPEGKPSAIEATAAADLAKSDKKPAILRLETSSQGGEMHVTKSAWKTRLTYVGGVAVSYLLTDQAAHVTASGVVAVPQVRTTGVKDSAQQLTLPSGDATP